MQSLTGAEINDEEMMKYHAKDAADTIVRAEQHKKDKKLMKHVKKELKDRAGHIEAAMGKKDQAKKAAPAKKPAAPAKKSAGKKK